MNLSVSKKELFRALTIAKMIPKNKIQNILNCVYLEPNMDSIFLQSTNLEIRYIASLGMERGNSGEPFVVDRIDLFDAVKALMKNKDIFTLQFQSSEKPETVILMANGTAVKELNVPFPPSDWPAFPAQVHSVAFTETAEAVKRMSKLVTFACASEKSRYTLNGVHMKGNATENVWEATDGRHLAQYKGGLVYLHYDFILDPICFKLLAEASGTLEWCVSEKESSIWVYSEKDRFWFKKLDGRFPKTEDVFPRGNVEVSLTLETKVLLEKIEFALALLPKKEVYALQFQFHDNTASVSAGSYKCVNMIWTDPHYLPTPLLDNMLSTCPNPLTVVVNVLYLREMLRVLKDQPSLTFQFRSERDPLMVEVGSWRYILMPINV